MGYAHGVPQIPIWLLLTLTGIFVGVPAIVIVAAVLLRASGSRSVLRSAGLPAGPARVRASRVTRRGLAGLGLGVLVGLALVADNRGSLAVLACAGGYFAGLLVGEYTGQPPARGPIRAARLLARRPADYAPRWAVAAAALTAAAVVAAPAIFAFAPTIRYGRWHPVAGQSLTLPAGQTSWPPVFPGTAAAAALALAVLGVGVAGLRRVAARPGPADAAQDVDELLRRQGGRAILGAVLGLELVTLAALLIAGSQGLAVPVADIAPGAYLGSRVMLTAGLCCAAAGMAAWLVLNGWTRQRRSAAPPPGPAAVTPGS